MSRASCMLIAAVVILIALLVFIKLTIVATPGARLASIPAQQIPCYQAPCCVVCTPDGTIPTIAPITIEPTIEPTLQPTIKPTGTQCSMKKGIAGGSARDAAELADLLCRTGASWFYPWSTGLDKHWEAATISGVELIPMLRKTIPVARVTYIVNDLGYRGGIWFIGNEPDNTREDNMSPEQAAITYGEVLYSLRRIDPTARVIMPNLVEPKTPWEKRFTSAWREKWGENPPIQGWGLHLYGHPKGTETEAQARARLKQWTIGWISDHPGKELWITETGNLLRTDIDAMVDFVNFLERTPGVTRYAYFWLGSYLDEEAQWDFTGLFSKYPHWPTETDLFRKYAELPYAPVESCK